MVATVRLDDDHETKLKKVAEVLHKKKSDVLREALDFYADHVLNKKKQRILKAVEKVQKADAIEAKSLEGTLEDGF